MNFPLKAPPTRGVRFAPSPTGRFHIGNLRTAWISREWARQLTIPWVVRFEDIDGPRIVPGARDQQLADMKSLDLVPDVIVTQSELRDRHWLLFKKAIEEGQVYPCDCSRKDVQLALAGIASAPHDGRGATYSGRCRTLDPRRALSASESLAWRFRMEDESGESDFIVARSTKELDATGAPHESGFAPSYHWACAIDDLDGDYDLLVRSSDLLPAAAVQRSIQNWLFRFEPGRGFPAVFHTALVTQNDGHRLEKRTAGVTLNELAKQGVDSQLILQRFAESIELSQLIQAVGLPPRGALLHEAPDRIPLAQLKLVAQK